MGRADVNMPTVEEVEGTSLSKDELLEVIKHERRVEPVSYTHLDVYKRQLSSCIEEYGIYIDGQ